MASQPSHARKDAAPKTEAPAGSENSPVVRARDATVAPLPALGNQALQALGAHAAGGRLTVGAPQDPAEHEADRMAEAALSGRRAAAGSIVGGASAPGSFLSGSARPLTRAERGFFEPRFNADLGHVRIHEDARAAASAAALDARAFSLGSRIAFGAGQYQGGSDAGTRLLAHELAHVLQGGDGSTIRRQPLASTVPSGPMCKAEPTAEPAEQMCKMPDKQDPANPTVLNLTGKLEERVASFKQLVKTTAVHRLLDNRKNLDAWAALVEKELPTADLAAMGLMQLGGTGPYFDLQDIRDPLMRELNAAQALGQFRFCTGCHIAKEIHATRGEREASALGGWSTPNEMRAGIKPASRFDLFPAGLPTSNNLADLVQFGFGDKALPAAKPGPTGPAAYQPPAGSQEARLQGMFPDPAATRKSLERAAPILSALGPEGYKVLPGDLLTKLETASSSKVRDLIIEAIRTRQGNYLDLIGKINSGEIGYEFFGPVVKKLMPLATADVQAAIQQEMDSQHFWEKVEQVVVAAMTALALLLAIFPPTSIAGVALFASLELSLGYYGVTKGNESMRLGEAYSLGVGAHDVFTPEQQQAADGMILGGFISAATGWLGIYSGLSRTAALASHLMPPPGTGAGAGALGESTALTRTAGNATARTFQQGEYVMTLTDDGAMVVTASSRPDLMIMVRGETATLYQLLEGGGMRVVARATIPRAAPATTPMLTGGGGASPMLTGGPAPAGLLPSGPTPAGLLTAGPAPAGLLTSGPAPAGLLTAGPAPAGLLTSGPAPAGLLTAGPAESGLLTAGPNPGVWLRAGDTGVVWPAPPVAATGPIITPPPPNYPQLTVGPPTTFTWKQIGKMQQPQLWEQREIYMRQIYGASGHQHFPIPGTGGRFVDVPVRYGGGRFYFAGEVKSFQKWIGVKGQKGGTLNKVDLSDDIKIQIDRDVWLRNNVPGYDPRWMFTDAPPSEALRQALRDKRIIFIEYLPPTNP